MSSFTLKIIAIIILLSLGFLNFLVTKNKVRPIVKTLNAIAGLFCFAMALALIIQMINEI